MMIISGLLGIHIPTTKTLRAVMLVAVALGAGAVFGQGRTLWQDGGVQLCGPSATIPMAATSDRAGGAIVVWTDTRNGSGNYGICAQRADAAGVTLWTEDGVLLCDSIWEGLFGVVDDGEHGAIAGWAQYRFPLAVQRVSAEGVPLWGPNGLELRPPSDSTTEFPGLVRDGHGGAIVVWSTYSLYSELDTLIACRVDSSGTKLWETVVRIDTLGVDPPRLCEDGMGGVIVEWSQDYSVSARVQRVDGSGAIRWDSAGVPVCTLSTVRAAGACMAVGESCFIASFWVGDSWLCRAQMFDLDGSQQWGPAGMPAAGGMVLSADNRRQSIWLWSENKTGTREYFAQKLDSTGARCWDSAGIWLCDIGASDGRGFSAAADGRGGAIATWALYRSQLNWDVYAQRVDSSGHLCWSDTGLAVCAGDNNARYPVAVTDGEGGAIVSWLDDRGIYAQRVADGAGITESHKPQATSYKPAATVVRGILRLADGSGAGSSPSPSCLMDASGWKVAVLHEGANDVRALSPGVYFVREAQAQGQARVVRKVVIAR